VIVGLDLERGVMDVVVGLEEGTGLVEDGVAVGAGADHEVRGRDLHVGRQGPDVEVVDVDDAVEPGEGGVDRVEVGTRRRRLHEDPDGL
jgi:hypothetical protein